MQDIIAGIVTFNPDIDRLRENIESVINQVKEICIVDNGSENTDKIKTLLYNISNVTLIELNSNLGIAYALNRIFDYSMGRHYEYVITLDQDSVCPNNMVEKLYNVFSEKIAIACPQINDINKRGIVTAKQGIAILDKCITSGSLTRIYAWKQIGGFDEKMFIDGVDFDFCNRLKKRNWVIVQNKEVIMNHEIGHITTKHFLGFTVNVKNHSAFRKYFIAKNIVYLDRKNKTVKYPFVTICRLFKQMVIIILFEGDKKSKIVHFIKGSIAGFKESIEL